MATPHLHRAALLAEIGRILDTLVPHPMLTATYDEAAIAILTLIDTHNPNPDDPTSCSHCGMADGVDHLDGCPCA